MQNENRWLVEKFIGADDVVVLSGPLGAGKTNVAMGWAMAVATGTPWRGQPVRQGGVVYLGRPVAGKEKEIASAAFLYAAASKIDLNQQSLPFSLIRSDQIDLLKPPGECKKSSTSNPLHELLDWHKKQYGSLRLLVIDTAADYFQGNLFQPEVIDDVLAVANAISSLYRCAVLLVFECEPNDGPAVAALARLNRGVDRHYKLSEGVLRRTKPYNKSKKMFTANFRAQAENKMWQEAERLSNFLASVLGAEEVSALTRALCNGILPTD